MNSKSVRPMCQGSWSAMMINGGEGVGQAFWTLVEVSDPAAANDAPKKYIDLYIHSKR